MFAMVDRVAEMATGHNWEPVFKMNVYEFLSIYCYSIDKQKLQENMMKQTYDKMRAKVKAR